MADEDVVLCLDCGSSKPPSDGDVLIWQKGTSSCKLCGGPTILTTASRVADTMRKRRSGKII